ncbi:FecCD family ABC transporter permease [Methanosarcina acetivorans]|uniref:Cobalamin import system permease protein BtuC n=1 Tax=Methanosarcina acetivorans (strain ATCC 35395 / DSM 2834 / JCM 12185 / C2A) TaxID=188937 RepID=Q8TRE6_METAC|nr:iron ABC transporter permease [Methanosarcina acetivorans]AAM04653.1 iron(III) ABC transporter, permease protein [Methanosarcina acetivorans C2A]
MNRRINRETIRNISSTTVLIALPVILFFGSFMIGRYPVSPLDVILAIVSVFVPMETNLDPTIYTVVWDIRLPRIIAAMIVGAALSISGASFQGTFQNPLVSPDILGVSSGAGFGAAIAILFSFSMVMIQTTAFLFGLLAVFLTYFLSKRFKGNTVLMMVLGGIAIAALFSALISCIKYLADPDSKLPEIVYWLMGSLSAVESSSILMIAGPVLVGFTALLLIGWRINVLSMSDDEARSLGINTEKMRLLIIFCCTLLTAAAVSISGIIGWVGLVIPHAARMIVGPDHRKLLPASISLGAAFLLLVDDVCRTATSIEIPLGILTAIIGAPFFVYLLQKGYEGWS